jgi:hypothetical protein
MGVENLLPAGADTLLTLSFAGSPITGSWARGLITTRAGVDYLSGI